MLGPMQLRVGEIPVVRCPGCRQAMEPKERTSVTDRHTLRVRKVRHGNEAHRQGRSVAGSQPWRAQNFSMRVAQKGCGGLPAGSARRGTV
jgi:hypothetical protein